MGQNPSVIEKSYFPTDTFRDKLATIYLFSMKYPTICLFSENLLQVDPCALILESEILASDPT